MIEREQQYGWSDDPALRADAFVPAPSDDWREQTVPGIAAVPGLVPGPVPGPAPVPAGPPVADPAILGFPAEDGEDDDAVAPVVAAFGRPVARRRGDVLAGLLLLLAGLAGGASLVLHWVAGERDLGLAWVQRGVQALGVGLGELGRTGLWQPLAVVLGGGVLFLLGVLLFVPARTHRALGVLALLVAAAAALGVLVPLAEAGWSPGRFDIGMWFAVAVGALGLLGALKAMLTGPRFPRVPRTR